VNFATKVYPPDARCSARVLLFIPPKDRWKVRRPWLSCLLRPLWELAHEDLGDPATAEDLAMLQALYSRDPQPIDSAIKLARADNSGSFMERFYVGYGHKSIADCGVVTLAIENVPMHIAKLIQHTQLYAGQEASTRYLNFANVVFYAPTNAGRMAQEGLRNVYKNALAPMAAAMAKRFCLDVSIEADRKAARAAAFDVLRGLIPVGAHTSLSWVVSLRHFKDHCMRMLEFATRCHPSYRDGLGQVIEKMSTALHENFPSSVPIIRADFKPGVQEVDDPISAVCFPRDHYGSKMERSKTTGFRFWGCSEPHIHVNWASELDFGSWRDLARHRSLRQTFPLLSGEIGPTPQMHIWYLQQILQLIPDHYERIVVACAAAYETKDWHAYPMGTVVPYELDGPFNAFCYLTKLRSAQTVHPTLRAEIFAMRDTIGDLPVSNDNKHWVVTSKRGKQDITLRS